LSSATALRAAVQADNRQAFSQAAGVDADTPVGGNAFFDVVKHYLMPHVEKAAAKPAKKKAKEPEQGMAEGGKKKKKKSSRYTGGYFFPGYGYYGSGESGEGGDGGGENINPKRIKDNK
jgi:hypothetical protein